MDAIFVTVKAEALLSRWKSRLRHLTTPTPFADIANLLVFLGIVPMFNIAGR